MATDTQPIRAPRTTKTLTEAMKYLGYYLLGIVACVLFTPVDLVLVGAHLWPLYPLLAVIGYFLFYLSLSPQYVFGPTFGYWMVYALGLVLVVLGVAAHSGPLRRLHGLRHVLIGFPVGFVGTLGVYYTAGASI